MPNPLDGATAAARELATLIRNHLPIECGTERWPSLGLAMLARMAGTTETIATLTPTGPSTDGFSLLRILYEHVVTFAWIAAGPVDERVDLFRKYDAIERIKTDNDLRSIGDHVLEPDVLRELEVLRDTIAGDLPKLPRRAELADLHWKDRIEGLKDSASTYSFRGMYRFLYRRGSTLVHPTLLGMNAVVKKHSDGTRTIHMEATDQPPYAIGMTAVVLGAALLVAEQALQWPPRGTVGDIMERHNWTPDASGS